MAAQITRYTAMGEMLFGGTTWPNKNLSEKEIAIIFEKSILDDNDMIMMTKEDFIDIGKHIYSLRRIVRDVGISRICEVYKASIPHTKVLHDLLETETKNEE